MADVEAVLLYQPSGFEAAGEFRLARTTRAAVLLALAQAAVTEAREQARLYSGLDPALAGASLAEADRLETVLRQILPAYSSPPDPGRPRLVRLPSAGKP